MSTPWTETSVAVAQTYRFSTSVSEIEEEEDGNFSSELFEINHGEGLASIKEEDASSLFSFDVNNAEDIVYVAVGKSESSIVGMLPKSKVSPSQVENYMAQERGKRRELLQKFLNICSASKVTVDTMLIESDMVAKAILDLIPILNIRKLVVGTSNCSPRKLKSRRGIGIADQIFQNAPDTCEVKVVCEGKEVITSQMIASPSASAGNEAYFKALQKADHNSDSFSCMCFRPKF